MGLVWSLLRSLSIRPPRYQTEEIDTNLLLKPKYPPITGYRILVTSCVVGLGSLKAGLSFSGKSTEPTTIEWVLGVVFTVVCVYQSLHVIRCDFLSCDILYRFYFLGLYEASSTRILPLLFEVDYTKQGESLHDNSSCRHSPSLVFSTAKTSVLLVGHGLGLVISGGWTYAWGLGIHQMWFEDLAKGPEQGQPPTTPFERFLIKLAMIFWTVGACVATSSGAAGTMYLIYSMGNILAPAAKKVYAYVSHHAHPWVGSASEDAEQRAGLVERFHNQLQSSTLVNQPHPRLRMVGMLCQYLSRFSEEDALMKASGYSTVFDILAVAGYVVAHAMAFLLAGGWTGCWVFGMYEIWKSIGEIQWYLRGFAILWSIGACVAAVLGFGGMLFVLRSFLSPITMFLGSFL
jgi:hypothetical protein